MQQDVLDDVCLNILFMLSVSSLSSSREGFINIDITIWIETLIINQLDFVQTPVLVLSIFWDRF